MCFQCCIIVPIKGILHQELNIMRNWSLFGQKGRKIKFVKTHFGSLKANIMMKISFMCFIPLIHQNHSNSCNKLQFLLHIDQTQVGYYRKYFHSNWQGYNYWPQFCKCWLNMKNWTIRTFMNSIALLQNQPFIIIKYKIQF